MFGKLFYVTILLINSIAILSEDRFLNRIGWGTSSNAPSFVPQEQSIKARLVHLISATRTLLRVPLIAINTLVILYELVLG